MLRKLPYIVIDIETRNLSQTGRELASSLVKPHPSTKDEAKRAAQVQAKVSSLEEKGALSDIAEIACIGIYSDSITPTVLHTFDFEGAIEGVDHGKYADEKTMLSDFCGIINEGCDENTEIVVANAGFDLPKIRYAAAIRNKTKIPDILMPRSSNSVFDILHIAGKYFLVNKSDKYSLSLDDLAKHLGYEGKRASGAEVPNLIDSGEFETVITYNVVDLLLTNMAYKVMSCRF